MRQRRKSASPPARSWNPSRPRKTDLWRFFLGLRPRHRTSREEAADFPSVFARGTEQAEKRRIFPWGFARGTEQAEKRRRIFLRASPEAQNKHCSGEFSPGASPEAQNKQSSGGNLSSGFARGTEQVLCRKLLQLFVCEMLSAFRVVCDDLPVACQMPFVDDQPFQTNGSARMDFVCADANFRT